MYLLDASSIHLKVDLAKASECASQSSQENARLEQLVADLSHDSYEALMASEATKEAVSAEVVELQGTCRTLQEVLPPNH